MSKTKLLLLTCLIVSSVESYATVSLQFSTASAKLTNIQNAAGDAAGGLRWGIVVSTTNASFDAGGASYDGFTFPASGNMVTLANGTTGLATDDVFYWAGSLTTASAGGTDSGTNLIGTINGVPLTGGISTGDPFALMWFDSSATNDGDKYGFLTDASFVIPADSATIDYSGLFLGPDPVRLASNTLGAVPEPSRFLLAGLGLLGLVMRRRRS
jgi:hypothetical protein